jgi:cell division control protein 45
MLDLSITLNKKNNNHLWYAIIGITEQLIFERITMDAYKKEFGELKKILKGYCNENKDNKKMEDDEIEIPISEDERIISSEEYRFVLFRHWNIFDAMFHSSYVASRLGIIFIDI